MDFTSLDDLSDVLVTEILLRLPAKTIVQSTSVCKLWHSIIKNPFFISAHLSRGVFDLSNSYIFIVQPQSPSVTVISDHNHFLNRHYPNFTIPFETRSQTYKIIGTCNGLICLTDHDQQYHGGDIYLINPFINQYRKIGADSSCYSDLIEQIDGDDIGTIRVFFWYCEVEKDYKIFRILFRYGDGGRYDSNYLSRRFEMYSLTTNTWRVMEGMDDLDLNRGMYFVNGCLYWASWPDYTILQCFDLKEKLYYTISWPRAVSKRNFPYHTTGVLAKEESVVFWNRRYSPLPQAISLYLLEKGTTNCWEMLFYHESPLCILDKYMGFSGIGRFIFCECYDREANIVAIDFDNSCAVETLPLDYGDVSRDSTVAFNVLESLVLFSGIIN